MTKRLDLVSHGFVRRKDLDFTDDGATFRGYTYGDLEITVCKDEKYYVSVRDFRNNSPFTYDDWRETEECKLADEFNGVEDVNVEKLIENCIKISAKIKELSAKVEGETIDTEPLKESLKKEIAFAEECVENFKQNYKWYEVTSKYRLTSASEDLHRVIKMITSSKKLLEDMDNRSTRQLRDLSQQFTKYGYVRIKEDDYWLRSLKDHLKEDY